MMNDIFLENLVPLKKDAKDKVIIGLTVFGGVILTLFLFACMLGISFAAVTSEQLQKISSMTFSIGLLLVAFVWYGAYLIINTRNVEYEYIVTNNELDIDKVMSKKGRKHLITIDVKNATCMGRIDDDSCNSVYKNPPEGVKILDYSANSKTSFTYFIDCTVDETRKIVLCQLTNKMAEGLWRYNPKNIKRYTE
ncbi:MAG: hypothetical protein ACI38A_09950 [Candidatus Ornithomonoglobus sp.]